MKKLQKRRLERHLGGREMKRPRVEQVATPLVNAENNEISGNADKPMAFGREKGQHGG